MAEKIQELNQKREAYMREQNWEGLVALYEDGITLFEAQERQQVHLTLAKLYELKLQDSARAFENMTAAFSLGGPRAIQEKIIEAMQRSGGGGAQKESYLAWLEEQAGATDLAPDSMELLQMTWSRHLRAEDPQRAFFSFASYLADNPEERASESTLAFFEELGEGVENLFRDLLSKLRQGFDLPGLASVFEGAERSNAQLFVEGPHLLGAEALQLEDLEEALGKFATKAVVNLQAAGQRQLMQLVLEGLPDSIDPLEVAVPRPLNQIALKGSHDFRALAESADFEGCLALQFQQKG